MTGGVFCASRRRQETASPFSGREQLCPPALQRGRRIVYSEPLRNWVRRLRLSGAELEKACDLSFPPRPGKNFRQKFLAHRASWVLSHAIELERILLGEKR